MKGHVSPFSLLCGEPVRQRHVRHGDNVVTCRPSKRQKKPTRKLLAEVLIGGALAGGSLAIGFSGAIAAPIYYTTSSSNAERSTIGLSNTTLGSGVMSNPSVNLALGSNIYTYVALLFRPTQVSATNVVYTFGQTQAPVDTIMILYEDRFDPTRPAHNALVGNDDTSEATHHAIVGSGVSISCGTSSFCP